MPAKFAISGYVYAMHAVARLSCCYHIKCIHIYMNISATYAIASTCRQSCIQVCCGFSLPHTHLRKHTLKAIIPDIRNLHELSAFTLINQFCSTATASACTCCALIELISIMRIVALLMCAQL